MSDRLPTAAEATARLEIIGHVGGKFDPERPVRCPTCRTTVRARNEGRHWMSRGHQMRRVRELEAQGWPAAPRPTVWGRFGAILARMVARVP